MDNNYTDITLVLDRSGSMQGIWSDVTGGIKSLIEEQKRVLGKILFTLVSFDDIYNVEINHVPISELNSVPQHVQPRGSTALLDAIGNAITALGERLAMLPESERPSKVVFIVQTDGYENASKKFSYDQISAMVREQTDKYNWQFVFLGANMDSISESGKMGVLASNAVNWSQTPRGTKDLYDVVSCKIASYSSGGCSSMGFTPEEKAKVEWSDKK